MDDTSRIISASLLRMRMKSPFFAALALFARFIPTQQLPTAATDGKDIFFNPEYMRSLTPDQQDGLLLHEVLHAALLHVSRRGTRDAKLWNIAADIFINGAIAKQGGYQLPEGGLRDPKLEHLSVEEIYELLMKEDSDNLSLTNADLLSQAPEDAQTDSSQPDSDGQGNQGGDSLSQSKKAALEAHWKNAMQQAGAIARSVEQGKLPAGMERELSAITAAQLDWRAYLWRYLVQTPTDFTGFDRRFIGRGLYLETLEGETVQVHLAIDTSGSIDQSGIQLFLTEVQGILSSYPHLRCDLYYVDAEAYGPYPLDPHSTLPKPKGGGGTSFVPFFDKVHANWDGYSQGVCVYLTDGYGTFPEKPPELPVLWVVTPGGLDLQKFPFGEAVRLLSV